MTHAFRHKIERFDYVSCEMKLQWPIFISELYFASLSRHRGHITHFLRILIERKKVRALISTSMTIQRFAVKIHRKNIHMFYTSDHLRVLLHNPLNSNRKHGCEVSVDWSTIQFNDDMTLNGIRIRTVKPVFVLQIVENVIMIIANGKRNYDYTITETYKPYKHTQSHPQLKSLINIICRCLLHVSFRDMYCVYQIVLFNFTRSNFHYFNDTFDMFPHVHFN